MDLQGAVQLFGRQPFGCAHSCCARACGKWRLSQVPFSQMKQMRREVADLLRANKQENARIRVEAVMREQNMLQVCVPV